MTISDSDSQALIRDAGDEVGVVRVQRGKINEKRKGLFEEGSKSLFHAETLRQRGRLMAASAAAIGAVWFDKIPTKLPLVEASVKEGLVVRITAALVLYQLVAFILPAWGQRAARRIEIADADGALSRERKILANVGLFSGRLGGRLEQLERFREVEHREHRIAAIDDTIPRIAGAMKEHRLDGICAGDGPSQVSVLERVRASWTVLQERWQLWNQWLEWLLPLVLSGAALCFLLYWSATRKVADHSGRQPCGDSNVACESISIGPEVACPAGRPR